MRFCACFGGWLLTVVVFATPSAAQEVMRGGAIANTYAILIGENRGGVGQGELRYAEQDAQRMAAVLRELGRFPATRTQVLLGPDKAQVLSALAAVGDELVQARARGEQAQLVFYYSGHARADAIHLGKEELPLSELRERVLGLPTTLTLIVLDACQSGAISRVKGAAPAAEFSYNSVARLRTAGVAVMASSSATELSQESEAMHASYFTHHLIVALRGAGDGNHDGTVSLSEAYRYAYDRTLSATIRTAVGGQHVTLETSLTGQGDVPITYPAEARAQLELPQELAADVLIEHENVVVAELHKVKGAALRLALPEGAYSAVLRASGALSLCQVSLRDGSVTRVATESCSALSESEARAKGYFADRSVTQRKRETWAFELGFGVGSSMRDAYTNRLRDFGFEERLFSGGSPLRLSLAVSRQLTSHLSGVVDLRNLDNQTYERAYLTSASKDQTERFEWSSSTLGVALRAHVGVFDDALRFYAQLGGGLGYVKSKLTTHTESYFGPQLTAASGVSYTPWRHFGFMFQAVYCYAPILHNELSEHHDSGGITLLLGVRFRRWEEP